MANEKNEKKSEAKKVEKPKTLTIANVFETEAVKGGSKKEVAERIVTTLKANKQEKTKRGILVEVAVPRQINAMLSEVEKRGRWKNFKNVGKDGNIKLEKTTQ